MEFDFQKFTKWSFVRSDFGNRTTLERMLGLPIIRPRIPPPVVVRKREVDALDEKLTSYLKGDEVPFTPEELDKYIVY